MSDPVKKDEFVPNVPGTGRLGTLASPWGEIHAAGARIGGRVVDEFALASPIARVPRGEAISGARCVYLAEQFGELRAFLASAMDATKWAQGFVIEAGPEGAEVDVWDVRSIPGLSGIVPRGRYFLGSAGEFSPVIPTGAIVAQLVGIGSTSAIIKARIYPPSILQAA
jgi:hypothetical protein